MEDRSGENQSGVEAIGKVGECEISEIKEVSIEGEITKIEDCPLKLKIAEDKCNFEKGKNEDCEDNEDKKCDDDTENIEKKLEECISESNKEIEKENKKEEEENVRKLTEEILKAVETSKEEQSVKKLAKTEDVSNKEHSSPAPPAEESNGLDLIDSALQKTHKLNLSMDEKEDLEDIDEEDVAKEFENFMKEMNQGAGASDFMAQLNQMLGGTLEDGEGDDNDIDDTANKMLFRMMDKDIIYEPLLEAREKMRAFVEKNEGNTKYKPRLKLIEELIELLDKGDNSDACKELMSQKFEQLQDLGGIPQEILSDCAKENPELAGQLGNCPIF